LAELDSSSLLELDDELSLPCLLSSADRLPTISPATAIAEQQANKACLRSDSNH
jgi:hypothetical protein